ncbi:S8 family peptidase [bacterium]|nr:S8 family peptidase [bacterium]
MICLLLPAMFTGTVPDRAWVFFKDKPEVQDLAKKPPFPAHDLGITDRALSRRSKMRGNRELIDHYDLPVSEQYIRQIESLGAEIRVRSRWLNGVSLVCTEAQLGRIRSLGFVRSVQAVKSHPVSEPGQDSMIPKCGVQPSGLHALEYGYSYTQLSLIRVPEIHDLGLTGESVLVGMIDSGFDTESYRVFEQTDITDKWDFYWDDDNPANQEGDSPTQHNHGTQTLSVIGGFYDGVLIGSAFGASFALAKTEWIPTETRLEEDLWVAGIEWQESLGADIVSSSLGYGYFDGKDSYTYDDLNGDICVTTVAGDIAAGKGVVVVTSAGNEAANTWHYILSPADGDSIIAVGAVDWNAEIASFSSGGPTADGRIKPDVVAMGSGVYSAKPGEDGSIHFVSGSGTSFSCPLAAGVCALILQAHPELGPMQVRDALRETADRSQNPDNVYGWGLVDAYKAVFYHGPVFGHYRLVRNSDGDRIRFSFTVLSDFDLLPGSVVFHYRSGPEEPFLDVQAEASVSAGGLPLYSLPLGTSFNTDEFAFYISVRNTEGDLFTGPVGAPDLVYRLSGDSEYAVPVTLETVQNYALVQNAPNPFNNGTWIEFQIPLDGRIQIKIADILGREIITLLDREVIALNHRLYWDGCDRSGIPVPSGLYFCTLSGTRFCQTRKMVVIR